jgi:hypothetical protein
MKLHIKLVMAVALAFSSTACMKVVAIPNHPGAVNATDNAIYDGILSARASIKTAQDQFKDNATVTMLLNQSVLPPFNRLEVAYAAYHTALAAGKADPGQAGQLQVQLDSVKAALTEALKGAVVPVK